MWYLVEISITFADDMLFTYQMNEFTHGRVIGMIDSGLCQSDVAEAAAIDKSTNTRLSLSYISMENSSGSAVEGRRV